MQKEEIWNQDGDTGGEWSEYSMLPSMLLYCRKSSHKNHTKITLNVLFVNETLNIHKYPYEYILELASFPQVLNPIIDTYYKINHK